jgi:hypothetical protein
MQKIAFVATPAKLLEEQSSGSVRTIITVALTIDL